MRPTKRVAGTVIGLWLLAIVSTQPAQACSGEVATLKTGIHGATSIYYARVVAAGQFGAGFFDLHVEVGRVVRGHAFSHVTKVIPNDPCNEIEVGDSGVVVLGSVNPFGDRPTDVYNFFYVIGPGRTTRAEATAALALAPPTDSAAPTLDRAPAEPSGLLILVTIAMAGFLIAARRLNQP